MGCDRALWGGGVAATPLRHPQNCRKSRDGGVATPWSAIGGGGVAPKALLLKHYYSRQGNLVMISVTMVAQK